jgi:hypothetical protein
MKRFTVLFFAMICVCGCKRKEALSPALSDAGVEVNVIEPVNVGSGLYYFDNTTAKLGKSLEPFIKKHPELELISMAPLVSGGEYYTYTRGYYVFFRPNVNR